MRIKHKYRDTVHDFELDLSTVYEKGFKEHEVIGYEGDGSVSNPAREKTRTVIKQYKYVSCPICGTDIKIKELR